MRGLCTLTLGNTARGRGHGLKTPTREESSRFDAAGACNLCCAVGRDSPPMPASFSFAWAHIGRGCRCGVSAQAVNVRAGVQSHQIRSLVPRADCMRGSKSVRGHLAVTEASYCGIDRARVHWLIRIASSRKHIATTAREPLGRPENNQGLARERHQMRPPHLHACRGDAPFGSVEIDVLPFRGDELNGSNENERR